MSLFRPRHRVDPQDPRRRGRPRWRVISEEQAIAEADEYFGRTGQPTLVWRRVRRGSQLIYRVGFRAGNGRIG
jgi:hypothetical protein